VRAAKLAEEALATAQEIGLESLVEKISAWRESADTPAR
jgi:hypothetical protein